MGKPFDGQRAQGEVNFYLDDPRMIDLPPGACWLHWVLNLLCVRERRVTLPSRYSERVLSRFSRLHWRSCRKYEHLLITKMLIARNQDGSLTVYGVNKLNPKIKWKDAEPARSNDSHSKTSFPNAIGIGIGIGKEEQEHSAMPVSPNVDNSKKKTGRSPKQLANDEILRAITETWENLKKQRPRISIVQEIATYCKDLNRDPVAVTRTILSRARKNPEVFALRFARARELPDNLESGPKLDQWQDNEARSRDRISGVGSIADVLAGMGVTETRSK